MASNLLNENVTVADHDMFSLMYSSFACIFREKDLNAKFIISMEKNKTTITNLKVSKQFKEGNSSQIAAEIWLHETMVLTTLGRTALSFWILK